MQTKSDLTKIGGLWLKESQKTGRDFFSGTLTTPNGETFDVMMFPNKYATPDNNQPLYTLHAVSYGTKEIVIIGDPQPF